jgi:DNA-directed RNA polymerase specialized sigma24 family protein
VLATPYAEWLVTLDSEELLERLVEAAVTGDEPAWKRLWSAVEPRLTQIIATPRFLGRLGQREDDRRNIVVEVLGRLRADDFRRLRIYLETRRANPSLKFMAWLRVVVKRVGIDYLRGHPDYIDRRRDPDRGSAPGEWVEAGTLPSGSKLHGDRPPVTNRGTAQQLLRYAAGAIPDVQRRALELWVQSESYEEIARVLEIESAAAAERMVRAAIERLRRRFRVEEDQ